MGTFFINERILFEQELIRKGKRMPAGLWQYTTLLTSSLFASLFFIPIIVIALKTSNYLFAALASVDIIIVPPAYLQVRKRWSEWAPTLTKKERRRFFIVFLWYPYRIILVALPLSAIIFLLFYFHIFGLSWT